MDRDAFFKEISSFFHFPASGKAEKERVFSDFQKDSFFLNTVPQEDHILPHIAAGGMITHPTAAAYGADKLPYYLLFFTVSGEGECLTGEETIPVIENTLLFLPPEKQFTFKTKKAPLSYHICFLSGDGLASYFKRLTAGRSSGSSSAACIQVRKDYTLQIFKQMDYLLSHPEEDGNFFLADYLGRIFIECMLEQESQTNVMHLPKHVIEMKVIFDTSYADVISLQNLEEKLEMNKYRLCRDFSKYMSLPPLQYLNKKRIKEAKKLLIQTDLPVHMIGETVGIPNTTHFIRLFTRETGITPLRFRMLHL